MIKTWKGKPTDILLASVYFVLYGVVIHLFTTIRRCIKFDEDIFQSIKDPTNFILTLCLLFFFMSPVWVYFRKVPKLLKIDLNTNKLEIHKRKRTLKYNIDKIRFYKRATTFFYILEIHATFELSNTEQIEKSATSIIVPNWGLSWNKRKIEEIIKEFNDLNIEEIKNRPHIPVFEYFYH